MRINLNEEEITTALIQFLQHQGFTFSESEVGVEYTTKRNPTEVLAEIVIGENVTEDPIETSAPSTPVSDQREELFDD